MTLTEQNIWYKLSNSSNFLKQTIIEFHHLGLLTLHPNDPSNSRFCVNSLMQSFLHSQKGSSQGRSDFGAKLSNSLVASDSSDDALKKQQFMIVESNFKVYAYTDSELYRAILRLFMREDYIFKNLVVGALTRESLKEAFKKRITARQIIGFIETHAHPQCRNSRAFALQKKMLLDQQNKAALVKANQAQK